jgi:hypothetical protein
MYITTKFKYVGVLNYTLSLECLYECSVLYTHKKHVAQCDTVTIHMQSYATESWIA